MTADRSRKGEIAIDNRCSSTQETTGKTTGGNQGETTETETTETETRETRETLGIETGTTRKAEKTPDQGGMTQGTVGRTAKWLTKIAHPLRRRRNDLIIGIGDLLSIILIYLKK